jgi:hypothetical protein
MKLYVLCTEQQKEDQSYYRLHGNSVLKTMPLPALHNYSLVQRKGKSNKNVLRIIGLTKPKNFKQDFMMDDHAIIIIMYIKSTYLAHEYT